MSKVRLGDIAKTTSGATPLSSIKEYYEDADIPWINSGEVGQYKINKAQKFISEKGFINSNTKFIPKGSVLIAMYGATAGRTSLLNIDNATTNQAICSILPNENISNFFLKYKFDTLYKYLVGISSGSARDNLSQKTIQDLILDLPDLPTQQKIASVLSALDDKIELNNRINAELEAMAKTLYDYWFVQFDFPNSPPLEGWQNSKNFDGVVGYKSSGGKMVYNETLKRKIPEGWEVKKLEEIEGKIVTGKTPPTKISEYFNGNIPFITIDDIRKQSYIFNAERNLTILGAESQPNKYVYSGDICVSCIGTIGIIGIVATTSQTNQQINTISQIKDYNRYFLLNSLKNYFEYNVGAKKGAVLDNMNKQEFSSIPILDANRDLKELFFDKVNPIYEKIKLNLKQNQELSALRDWLLPMLMNGQVKVREN